jgi:hypothetical protein
MRRGALKAASLLIALAACPAPSAALSCIYDDRTGVLSTDDVVIAEVVKVSRVGTEIAGPGWYVDEGTRVAIFHATLRPLKVLRGDGKMPTLTYEFRDPKSNCEYQRPSVRRGQKVIFGTWDRKLTDRSPWNTWVYENTLQNRMLARRKQAP